MSLEGAIRAFILARFHIGKVKPGEGTIFGSIPHLSFVSARFKGSLREAVPFYPVWQKMASNSSLQPMEKPCQMGAIDV
jgi:hypothetical protein